MAKTEEYSTFHLRVKTSHLTKLERLAEAQEKTKTDLIREAIRHYLERA